MTRRKLTGTERKMIHDKCQGHCAYCGCEIDIKDMCVDHVIPLHNGGTDIMYNMLPACRSCNHRKGTENLESFRESVGNFVKVLERDSVTYKNAVRFGLVTVTRRAKWPIVFYFERGEK